MAAKRRDAAEGPSLLLVIAVGILIRFAIFHLPSCKEVWQILERRPEFSTPVSSFMTIKEAIYLRLLYRSSPKLLPKPYKSKSLYLPPVLLSFLDPLFSGASADATHIRTSILWTMVDAMSALLIVDIFKRKRRYISKTHRGTNVSSSASKDFDLNVGSLIGSGGTIAAMYLLNPYTIGSCLARSTTSLNSFFILASADASMAASPLLLAISLSAAILTSLYPVLLLPSLVLLCAQQGATSSKTHRKREQSHSISAAILSIALILLALAAGIYGSFLAAENDWSFVSRVYGTILTLPDLSPNIGLWWYFFIEIFDHFRNFFLLAFNVHVASYSIPLTIRFRQDPLFAVIILCGFTAALKSYPSMGDTALSLSLLSLYPEITPYLRHPLVTTLLFIVATILIPALHHLWLSAGSGNANFLYASTLVWALAGGSATLDAMWAWGRWRWELERPIFSIKQQGKGTGILQQPQHRRKVIQV